MLSWSLGTLSLSLTLIMAICAAHLMIMVFRYAGLWWGLLFVVTPVAYAGLSRYTGPAIAGLVIALAEVAPIRKFWKDVGRIYVYQLICWASVLGVVTRTDGWRVALLPPQPAPAAQVVQASEGSRPVEGFAATVRGRVWYARTGAGSGTPLILIHDVPGGTSHSLKPLEALGDDRAVIRYDQFGAGHSAADGAIDTASFTIAAWVAELDSVRAALGLDRVHLFAHGTGAIVALEYARARPQRVASIVFAGPMLSGAEWAHHTALLVATLPDTSQRAIMERSADADYDAMDYVEADELFFRQFVSRHPRESDRDSLAHAFNADVYHYLWGPAELALTGKLAAYDARRSLRRLRVPTLYTVGEFDVAGPDLVKGFAAATPASQYVVIPRAAHYTMWDNADSLVAVVRGFLRAVDAPPPPEAPASTP